MFSGKYGTFMGGIDLPDDKQATLMLPIRPCATPKVLKVPLSPTLKVVANAIVDVGQRVNAGQKIAQAKDGFGIYAPLAGKVSAICNVFVATSRGPALTPAIELSELSDWTLPDLQSKPTSLAIADFENATDELLREKIIDSGIFVHRGHSERLSDWLERAKRKQVKLLLANAMEDQPYVSADHRLLAEQGPSVVMGLAILARAIGVKESMLAADQRHTDHYRRLIETCRKYKISTVALPHKYPIGADAVLVKVLTRKERPIGGCTMDVGTAVIDVATCFAVYRWVTLGRRADGRVVTVGGDNAESIGNFWVPFGMPCGDLQKTGQTLIHGGPMVGQRCMDDSVVTPATDALITVESQVPVATPCIRCSWCTDHCPARLNVAVLNDAYELGMVAKAQKMGALSCMDCGVCSYLCPARLPLSQRVKQLKASIGLNACSTGRQVQP